MTALSPAAYTQRLERVRDIAARRRAQTHCHRGHEFTPENTHWSHGKRTCCACRRMLQRETHAFHLGQLLVDRAHPLHGTPRGYHYGCRCAPCRAASSLYRAELAARHLAALQGDPNHEKHGSMAAYGYGCRCERCRAAKAVDTATRWRPPR